MHSRNIQGKRDSAVATVIGALLLTALAVTFFTAYTLWYVPTTTTNNIGTVITSQASAYDSLSEKMQANVYPGELITQSFPLGYGGAPPFSQASDSSLSFLNNTTVLSGKLSYGMNLTLTNTTLPASGNFNPVAIENITINAPKNEPYQYQQQLVIDSNSFKKYEAGNLQNIIFTYPNGTIIPSWLQCGNSNTSTMTVYWLNIHTNGTTPIQMKFYNKNQNMFNNFETGEAPNLTSPYGQYDDGASVFLAYFNGNTNPKDFSVADNFIGQPILSLQKNPQNDAMCIETYSGCYFITYEGVTFDSPLKNIPMIVQSNFKNVRDCIMGSAGLVDNSQASNVENALSIDTGVQSYTHPKINSNFEMQYVNSCTPQLAKIGANKFKSDWLYSSLYYNNTSNDWEGSVTSSPIISDPVFVNGTCTVNPLKSTPTLYMGIIIDGYGDNNKEFVNWMRAIAQPSGDKMPSYTCTPVSKIYVLPYHPYVRQISGSFTISGALESSLDVGNVLSSTFYLADGGVISYHGTTPVFSYGFPISIGNYSTNKSISLTGIQILGNSISQIEYGSSIVSLLASDTSFTSYQTGENLTLLTTGLEPYTAVVSYINLTSLNYTVSGKMASVFNQTLYNTIGNGAKISNDTWQGFGGNLNFTYRDNTFSITLIKGKVITLQSISILTTRFNLESL